MASYKLTYFDARGRGEGIRYIFAQAGVKYEDNRIKREDWPKLKETTPFGQLPILEVDGKVLSGSGSICRLLAEKFGLAGLNEFENAELDSIADFINDFALTQITKFWGEKTRPGKLNSRKKSSRSKFHDTLVHWRNELSPTTLPMGGFSGQKSPTLTSLLH